MCASAFSRVRRAANGRCPIPMGTGSTSPTSDQRSLFRNVDVDAFDVGQVEAAVLGTVQQRQAEHVRVELGATFGVARAQRDMRDRAWLNPIVLGIDVLLLARTLL